MKLGATDVRKRDMFERIALPSPGQLVSRETRQARSSRWDYWLPMGIQPPKSLSKPGVEGNCSGQMAVAQRNLECMDNRAGSSS